MRSLASRLSQLRGVFNMLYPGWVPFTALHVNAVDLTGRNALVSGSNGGIGYDIALKLAQFGANVWLLCRDVAKAEAARAKLIGQTGNQNITVSIVDFASLASIQRFADEWLASKKQIDILVNNAGMSSEKYLKTVDGYEITYQTNFLSHILLVLILLPSCSDRARIINVTSHGHFSARKEYLNPEDADFCGVLEKNGVQEGDKLSPLDTLDLYQATKALIVIFGRQLQQRLSASPVYSKKHIVTHSCHPGLVTSAIWEGKPRILVWVVSILGISCEQGACTPVFTATAPEAAADGGGYWDRMAKVVPNDLVLDDTLGDALWDSWLSKSGFGGLSKDLQTRK